MDALIISTQEGLKTLSRSRPCCLDLNFGRAASPRVPFLSRRLKGEMPIVHSVGSCGSMMPSPTFLRPPQRSCPTTSPWCLVVAAERTNSQNPRGLLLWSDFDTLSPRSDNRPQCLTSSHRAYGKLFRIPRAPNVHTHAIAECLFISELMVIGQRPMVN